jgi:HSP20 family protein
MEAMVMLLHKFTDNGLWGSLREMQELRQRLNNLLSLEEDSAVTSMFPPLNTWVSEDAALVTAELPGADADQIELSVVNNTLTIKGTHCAPELSSKDMLHRQERPTGQFTRSVQLPFEVEADNVEARFCKGVLQIKLPRAESEKPRKIAVRPN